MFEHVGSKNYKDFFSIVHHNMKNDGITLLHTIGKNDEYTTDKWIEKYIFPNGELPNVNNIIKFKDKLLLDDWHNFGKDYNLTLIAWQNNFKNAWPELKNKYDDRFYRMWVYYLNVCAAAFYVRNILLWQLILTKKEKKEQYRSFRY